MSKTLVFGTSGFLGSVFLRHHPHLLSAGRSAPALCDVASDEPNIESFDMKNHITVPDMDSLHLLDDVEFDKVIFLVGNSNHHMLNKSCMDGIEYNVIPLKKMLHYLSNQRPQKIKKFVCLTSILLYGNVPLGRPVDEHDEVHPYTNQYIFSKHLAEEVVRYYSYSLPIINVRISNIYGSTSLERPDLVPTLMLDALTKENPTVWNDKPQRDFIYAPDACVSVPTL